MLFRSAGVHLVINLAASNVLARQINAGARVDLFISADDAQMDAVARQLLPGTRVMLVRNQLAVAVPRASTRSIRQVSDLLDTGVRRIALGDPESVPAGVYARLYLERVGLWSALRPRLVPSASVRAALASVERGAADAAFVYRTDLSAAPRARLAFVVPVDDGPPIGYPAAVVRTGHNVSGASQVLDVLRGAEALAVFRAAGFLTP